MNYNKIEKLFSKNNEQNYYSYNRMREALLDGNWIANQILNREYKIPHGTSHIQNWHFKNRSHLYVQHKLLHSRSLISF